MKSISGMRCREAFVEAFQASPDHIAVAPGRVNIIGEHIDYCGFSVLPCALDRCAYVAIMKKSDETVSFCIRNAVSHTYPSKSFEITTRFEELQQSAAVIRDWSDYIVCGAYAAAMYLSKTSPDNVAAQDFLKDIASGLYIMVHSDIPAGAGLSSSSALVVASCFAILKYTTSPEMSIVATCCTQAERLIGTMGGGMDQTVCCLAQTNTALHVHFSPTLSVSRVPLPSSISFVICDSLVKAEKSQGAKNAFNTRVCECRLAAALLAQHLKLEGVQTLRDVVEAYLKRQLENDDCTENDEVDVLLQLVILCSELLPTSCTYHEISQQLSNSSELFTVEQISLLQAAPVLCLKQRATHVFLEAVRVLQFCHICSTTNWEGNTQEALVQLGAGLNASHDSLKDLYECSCAELDELVVSCRGAGALGARVTGAGWGGCVVAMIFSDNTDSFVKQVHDTYYSKRGAKSEDVASAVFVAKASGGAKCV